MGIIYGDTIIRFDPTISWGTLLAIATFLLALTVAYQRIKAHAQDEANRISRRLDQLEIKMNLIWAAWRRHNGARTDEDEQFFQGPH